LGIQEDIRQIVDKHGSLNILSKLQALEQVSASSMDSSGATVSGPYDKDSNEVGKLNEKQSTVVQTVILSKDRFKSKDAAITWIKNSKFKFHKVDEATGTYRFRQKEPSLFKQDSYRTKKLDEGISIVVAIPKDISKHETSKFVAMANIIKTSKFQMLPTDIKSDLDLTIPMNVEIWILSEGENRDGMVPVSELVDSVPRWEGEDIIPFHDMSDMSDITEYSIADECGSTDTARIGEKDGKKWVVTKARITNRNIAYQMYLKQQKGEPIEVSAEYRWIRDYDGNGNVIQRNIRPGAISLVKRGHIKGNEIKILNEV